MKIPVAQADYERPRRACIICAARLSKEDFICPTRYAVAIAAPKNDMFHKQAAVRHLSAALDMARKTQSARKAYGRNGNGVGAVAGAGNDPLAPMRHLLSNPVMLFEALAQMLSTEVCGVTEGRMHGRRIGWNAVRWSVL